MNRDWMEWVKWIGSAVLVYMFVTARTEVDLWVAIWTVFLFAAAVGIIEAWRSLGW